MNPTKRTESGSASSFSAEGAPDLRKVGIQARKAPARPMGSTTMTEDRRGLFFIVSFSFDFLFLYDMVLSFRIPCFPDIG